MPKFAKKCYSEVGVCQRYKRTQPSIEFLEKEAERNKVSVNELLSIIIEQVNYHGDRRVSSSSVANVLREVGTVNLLPVLPACHLQMYLQLGRTSYRHLRVIMKDHVSIEMPSWNKIREYQKEITPTVQSDTELVGVRFS